MTNPAAKRSRSQMVFNEQKVYKSVKSLQLPRSLQFSIHQLNHIIRVPSPRHIGDLVRDRLLDPIATLERRLVVIVIFE